MDIKADFEGTGWTITVDDKDFYSLSYSQQKELVNTLVDKSPEGVLRRMAALAIVNIGKEHTSYSYRLIL